MALLAAREAVPGLQVVVKPHLRGRAWLVDRCCDRVYLAAQLTAAQHAEAVIAALAVLVAAAGAAAGAPHIPGPRHRAPDRDWQQTG